MKILSWFPKPKALTELTLLSMLEIIVYGLLFVASVFLYYKWNSIPIYDIYINIDRIDERARDNNSYNCILGPDYQLVNHSEININLPYSYLLKDSVAQIFIKNDAYRLTRKMNSIMTFSELEKESNFMNTSYLDSLLKVLKDFNAESHKTERNKNSNLDKQLVDIKDVSYLFHNKIKAVSYGVNINKKSTSNYYVRDKYGIKCPVNVINHKHNGLFESESQFECFYDSLAMSQKYGVLSKPSVMALRDISQAFYRFHIRTQLINIVDVKVSFLGANNIKVIETEPDSINGQDYYYNFKKPVVSAGLGKDFVFHLESKEFEGIQKARLFFITTLLSAIVTLFLAFFIIYFYRKSKIVFRNKDKRLMDKLVNSSKTKRRKYKSRK